MYLNGARHLRRINSTSHKFSARHLSFSTSAGTLTSLTEIRTASNLHKVERLKSVGVAKPKPANENSAEEASYNYTKILKNLKDEIVISGISGRFPQCDNLEEFKQNLMTGVDMVCKQTRFKVGTKVPPCYGFMKNLDKFDAKFFGVSPKMAQVMDPALRKLFEVTFEAVVDAGVNPERLKGTSTGVFVGTTGGEGMDYWCLRGGTNNVRGYYFLGNLGIMQANHLSFTFDLKGPSMVLNTGCSASLVALEAAVDAIQGGKCDTAIVASTSTQLNPLHSYEMKFLNALSPGGKCKSFDRQADGFARGEAVVALLIQRRRDAKREYAKIHHVKSNSDGFKKEGIFFPSGASQERLLQQMYQEAGIDPGQVRYVEAHGPGTPAGDPQELQALANVFCKDDSSRSEPLLVGSVKSNMGHGESAAGLCGIAKILIASQSGVIPANLHFNQPSEAAEGLFHQRGLKVIAEPTPWEGGIVGVSAFGFGGTNAHAILEVPAIQKPVSVLSEEAVDQAQLKSCNYAIVVPFSGGSEALLKQSLDQVTSLAGDLNFTGLIHDVFQRGIPGHEYRGYGLIAPDKKIIKVSKCGFHSNEARPLWFIFPGMGSQWNQMGKDLLQIDLFSESFRECKTTLKNVGIDLEGLLEGGNPRIFENIRDSVVAITAIQVALYDTISSLVRKPDGYIGHSFGELLCAYADGCLSREETLLVAEARGRAFLEAQTAAAPGGMASVGLSWPEINSRCGTFKNSKTIFPACHNAHDNVTVSGPLEDIQKFVTQLQSEGIFAKEVYSCAFAAHSKYVEPAVNFYMKYLSDIYEKTGHYHPIRKRSSKWVSTTVSQSEWQSSLAQYASPAYHVHNMTNPVLFHEAVQFIPTNAVVIEIAPRGLFQAILKGSLAGRSAALVAPMCHKSDNKLEHFLMSVGDIYSAGLDVDFAKIYPAPRFPVPGQTPGIGSLLKWDHAQDWPVPITSNPEKNTAGILNIDLNDNEQSFLEGHKLDNRCVFPATGYLVFAWQTLAASMGLEQNELPVIFENVNFERATFLSYEKPTQLRCSIFPGSGLFEVYQDGGGGAVVRGKIYTPENPYAISYSNLEQNSFNEIREVSRKSDIFNSLSTSDIYKEIKLKGYNYSGSFRGIQKADIGGNWAEIGWDGNWTPFLDCALQSSLLAIKTRNTVVPIRLLSLSINPKEFFEFLNIHSTISEQIINSYSEPFNSSVPAVPCVLQKDIGAICCPGIEIRGITAALAPRKKQEGILSVNEYRFTPYFDTDLTAGNSKPKSDSACLAELIGIVYENSCGKILNIFDVFTKSKNSVTDSVFHILSSQPNYEAHLNILSTAEELNKMEKQVLALGTVFKKSSMEQFFLDHPAEIVAADLVFLDDVSLLGQLTSQLRSDAWIVVQTSQNSSSPSPILFPANLQPIARKICTNSESFLLKTAGCELKPVKGASISTRNYDWLENLKFEFNLLQSKNSDSASRLYIYSQNEPTNGLVGLIKCLRLEPGGNKIRCIFDPEGQLILDFENPDKVLREIIEKDLVMNILKGNCHGSYRHFPLTLNQQETFACPPKRVENARMTMLTLGDLSSFRWVEQSAIEFPAEIQKTAVFKNDGELYSVHYSSLNFLNVMLATGKLPIQSRKEVNLEDILLGFEFAGLNEHGERRMGVVASNTLASSVLVGTESLIWKVPDHWSLEEAASVPVVYATAYYALLYRAQMRPGQSILIHSGSGGTGQAAINLALSMHCDVFTTVGSEEKRNSIKQLFPQLKDSHIGNSRDCAFEKQILRLTAGRGMDLVLNSLADDKLQASVRCLATNGKFLEIGKFDASQNHSLGMECFLKNIEFHGIDFEQLLLGQHAKEVVLRQVQEGIEAGVVKPLARKVFLKEQVEDAFRYMMGGKHIGKVVIQVRDDPTQSQSNGGNPALSSKFQAIPRTHCHPKKSYLIVGGLGGMGLEVANWLVDRGAQHLILTSRSGITTAYQNLCIRKWEGQGVWVDTPIVDLANFATAQEFIQNSCNSGRVLGGIFNSGLVVKDALFTGQTEEGFEMVGAPKIKVTQNLDKISRESESIRSNLDYFVVFSSIACGLGNPGQSNYGFANAVMESICEARRNDGLPSLALQWGVIGDVGYVAEKLTANQANLNKNKGGSFEHSMLGLFPQRISSCLEVLDATLEMSKIKSSPSCFSSMIVADKLSDQSIFKKLGLTAAVARICGIQDITRVNPTTPLTELGIDSLSGIELKQLFERDYSLELSPKQIRGLNFGDLKMIEAGNFEPGRSSSENISNTSVKMTDDDGYMAQILKSIAADAKESLIKMKTGSGSAFVGSDDGARSLPLFLVHGGDGLSAPFLPMAEIFDFDFYAFQLILQGDASASVRKTIEDLAGDYIEELKQVQPQGPYNISGYSSGSTLAFEMATRLESCGDKVDNLIILDGFCSSESVSMGHSMRILVTEALEIFKQVVEISEMEEREVVEKFSETPDDLQASKAVLMAFLEQKLAGSDQDSTRHPQWEGIRNYFERMISFVTMSSLYRPSRNFGGKCYLIKPSVASSGMDGFKDDTAHLKQYCDQPVTVSPVRGDHHSFLSAANVVETVGILNEILKKSGQGGRASQMRISTMNL